MEWPGPSAVEHLPDDAAVCTAADGRFFPGVQLLFHSFRRLHEGRFVVFDLGLSMTQRTYLQNRGADVRPPKVVLRNHPGWQTYNKPEYMAAVEADRVLWIDADCIILKPISPLLDVVRSNGLFLSLQPESGERLRLRCDLSVYVQLGWPRRFAPIDRGVLNAGVVGLQRGEAAAERLLERWRWSLRQVAADPEFFLPRVAYQDQGLLLWALEYLDLFGKHTPIAEWNFPWPIRPFRTPRQLVAWLQKADGPTILHTYGRRKPWL